MTTQVSRYSVKSLYDVEVWQYVVIVCKICCHIRILTCFCSSAAS